MKVQIKAVEISCDDDIHFSQKVANAIGEVFATCWLEGVSEDDPIFVTVGSLVYEVRLVKKH